MSATATEQRKKGSEASSSPSQTINEVFHETMRGYEKALKTGIELQEQSIGFWSDLLTKIGSPEQLQTKWRSVNADLYPDFSKQIEESVAAYNLVNSQAVSLVQKSTGLLQATSIPEAQRCFQEYMEAVLGTARVNFQLALGTSMRLMNLWNDSALKAAHATE